MDDIDTSVCAKCPELQYKTYLIIMLYKIKRKSETVSQVVIH